MARKKIVDCRTFADKVCSIQIKHPMVYALVVGRPRGLCTKKITFFLFFSFQKISLARNLFIISVDIIFTQP